jgi:hypothetical protein
MAPEKKKSAKASGLKISFSPVDYLARQGYHEEPEYRK